MRGADRYGNDDARWMLAAHNPDGGVHGRAGRHAVVDEDDHMPEQRKRGTDCALARFAAPIPV